MLPLFVVRKVLGVDIVKKPCPWSWHSINLENYCFISYQTRFVDCFIFFFLKTQENFSTFLYLISYWTDMISCVSNLIQLGDILSKRVQRNFDKMCGMRPRDFYRGDPVCMYSENTFCCGLNVIRFPGIAKLYLQPSSRHKVFLSLQSVNLSSKKSL